jgi:hypothetical protein
VVNGTQFPENMTLILRRLQHKFEVELKDGTKQTRTSTLCEYGSAEPGGYSAMAKLGESSDIRNRSVGNC